MNTQGMCIPREPLDKACSASWVAQVSSYTFKTWCGRDITHPNNLWPGQTGGERVWKTLDDAVLSGVLGRHEDGVCAECRAGVRAVLDLPEKEAAAIEAVRKEVLR